MEITDSRQIEIFHTLEKIERMNKAILFHKATQNPDSLALEQYEAMKAQLTQQLLGLLEQLDLRLKQAA
jgi:hypothetical protein